MKYAVVDGDIVLGSGQELVEIAVVHVSTQGGPTRPPWHTFVDPETPMLSYPGESEDRITDERLRGQPRYREPRVHDPFMAELDYDTQTCWPHIRRPQMCHSSRKLSPKQVPRNIHITYIMTRGTTNLAIISRHHFKFWSTLT